MLFERNLKGETPLSICIQHQNQKAVEIFEKLQVKYEKTRQIANDLIASLEAEEYKAEKEKQRKKERKYKKKLQKLAERDHCSLQEIQERHTKEKATNHNGTDHKQSNQIHVQEFRRFRSAAANSNRMVEQINKSIEEIKCSESEKCDFVDSIDLKQP